jgi:nitrate reductase alpha subunit
MEELKRFSIVRVPREFAARAIAAGGKAEVVILPGASHYDEVAASAFAWPRVLPAIEAALGMDKPGAATPATR